MKKIIVLLCSILALSACSHKKEKPVSEAVPMDTVSVSYATGFSLLHYAGYTEAIVYNPWNKNQIQARYYLLHDSSAVTPDNGIRVVVPVERMAVASCTHIGFLAALNELSSVKGVCLPDLIYNKEMRQRCAVGEVVNLGDPLNINLEQLMILRPEVVMVSGYGQNDASYDRLSQVDISVLYNNEWMERTPLARAEWLKFVAAFYNREQLADSLFGEVEKKYNRLVEVCKQTKTHKTLMTGGNFRGTWYVPSGKTYMGHFFADAGADYFYAADSTVSSIPLNIETVIRNFGDADVWVGCSANTLKELREMDEKHTLFKAYRQGQVYNFNRRRLNGGANEFWELGVVCPDQVLSDLIYALYPNLLPDYEPFFIKRLP